MMRVNVIQKYLVAVKILKLEKVTTNAAYLEAEGDKEFESGSKEIKSCIPVTQTDYDKIKDYIKDYEKEAKDELGFEVDISIDCASNYVMISLLSLIILFL